MNSFVLKIIACITMFIDHIGYVIFDDASFFNYIGRIAFPIFAFQISEGFIHTRNLKKYLLRLLIFAILSQIPFMLFLSIFPDDFSLNVIFTLILGLLSVFIYNKTNILLGILSTIFLGISSELLCCDYGFYGVAIVFLFYIFHNNKIALILSFIFTTIINYSSKILEYYSDGLDYIKYATSYYLPYAICTCLSVIFIALYNKKKGPNTKYILYLFYPLHLLLIYIISYFI